MATRQRTIEQIRFNVSQGYTSFDDTHTVLARYEALMDVLGRCEEHICSKIYRQFRDMEDKEG